MPPALAAQMSRDGAVCVRGAFCPEWVDVLRAAAEDNMDAPGPLCDEHAQLQGTGGRFHDDQFLWRRHDAFRSFVLDGGAGAIAARAMGSSAVRIFYDQLLVKEPGTEAPTPWHNDTSYWHLRGSQICSTWIALDEVKGDAGVAYVKGSHKMGLVHRVTRFSGDNTYADSEDLPEVPDVDAMVADGSCELLTWDMAPGDLLVFYSATIHGAPGNVGPNAARRRGYACRWLGDDVTFDPRPGTMNDAWVAAGYNAGVAPGAAMESELHPAVAAGA